MKLKEYGFLSFAKNIGINVRNKYSRNLLDKANKSTTDAINNKNYFKKRNSNNSRSNWGFNWSCNSWQNSESFKKSSRELQKKEANNEIEMPKER